MAIFRKKEGNIGLDIGSHLVKLVEVRRVQDAFELSNLGIAQLYEVGEEEKKHPRSRQLVETIQSLLGSSGIAGREVAISMSSRELIIKRIELDRMSEEEVGQIIRWEAEQHIPFNIDDVYIDFHILDPKGEGNQMEVLLVAGKKMNVDSRVQLVLESGLEPVVVDVDAFAIQNAFELNYPEVGDETVCLLNIGRDMTIISLVRQRMPLVVRDIPFGNSILVEKLRKGLGISVDDAESYVLGIVPGGVHESDIRTVILSATEDLIVGITRTFSYLKTLERQVKPGKLYLSGGGARIPGLGKVLEERLEVPIEVANPFRNIHVRKELLEGISLDEVSPLLMQAVGLGLR